MHAFGIFSCLISIDASSSKTPSLIALLESVGMLIFLPIMLCSSAQIFDQICA